ncbi:MAG: DUF1015 domain-containing protein [Clostridiales bacterium]|jgi:uncharacterized protein (DUF1015 family)|nr:DUF1015 domain-containing protein [Clostridiales bacterium]
MAEIKPFRALRFDTQAAGDIRELCCPPYDIISEQQRRQYLDVNEHNVVRLELPKGENPYEEAGALLRQWQDEGILKRDQQDGLYIYEEEFEAHGQRMRVKGVICRVKVEEFSKGVVLPHEETLSKAKTDRLNLMKTTFCNFSQIYSLYMDETHSTQQKIDRLSQGDPQVEMEDGSGVVHRLWVVTDPQAIREICGDFKERKLYIADGHHRYETALNFRNDCRERGIAKEGDAVDYIMMMLVDMEHDGLVVFPTHRLVRDLASFDPEAVKRACEEYFAVEEKEGIASMEAQLDALYQQGKKAFGFYTGGDKWTLLTLKSMEPVQALLPEACAATQGLDVTVLHSLVLEKIFGIDKENMAQQINLTYTREFKEAVQSVQKEESQCAFILNPTRVTEIRDVAAAGEKMPQKSTYFYPKLITGLVMNQMER